MSKTNLKHVSAYLPYSVNVRFQTFNGKYDYFKLGPEDLDFVLNGPKKQFILRPLSDLTTEITVDGKTFIPIDYNAFKHDRKYLFEFMNKFAHYKSVKYGIIERLLEWHFDIFGLIDSGDAVNIHEVEGEL